MNFNSWFERIYQLWERSKDICPDIGDKQRAYEAAKQKVTDLNHANEIEAIAREQIKYKRKRKELGKGNHHLQKLETYFNKQIWTQGVGSYSALEMEQEPATKLNGHKPFEPKNYKKSEKSYGVERLKEIKQILR